MNDIKERGHVESFLRVIDTAASTHSLPSALSAGLSNTQADCADYACPYGVAFARISVKVEQHQLGLIVEPDNGFSNALLNIQTDKEQRENCSDGKQYKQHKVSPNHGFDAR